jgi:RNA polymerase sigma-70 factor (ECF subfamily)
MNRKQEFEENLSSNRRSLISFILNKVRRTMDAEDVLQRASVIMWNKYDTFDSTTNFMSWACTIASFEVKNYMRSFFRCPVAFNSEVYDVISLLQIAEDKVENDIHDKLRLALTSLDEESKNLLIQVYVNGEEIKDLAKKAKKSPQTYYNKLTTLKKTLAEKLK